LKYPVIIQPLPLEEGGGFDATVPDLLGSMSEATTPEEALTKVQDAVSRGLTRLMTWGGMWQRRKRSWQWQARRSA
jgi:predicted RNase H-like HicB family nuclease